MAKVVLFPGNQNIRRRQEKFTLFKNILIDISETLLKITFYINLNYLSNLFVILAI